MMSLSVWKLAAIISILHTTQAQSMVCYKGSLNNFEKVALQDADQLIKSGCIDTNKPTVLSTHGYCGNCETEGINLINDAELKCRNVNVLCLDWSKQACCGFPPFDYVLVVFGLGSVSVKLAKAMILMAQYGLNIQTFHMIGHSLGAHVCGNAGKRYTEETGNTVERITGLDPAGPFYDRSFCNINEPIRKTDANFVDIWHTDKYGYGMNNNAGTQDYYFNSKQYSQNGAQPGCVMFPVRCSHQRSVLYFVETICVSCSLVASSAERAEIWENPNYVPPLTTCLGENTNQTFSGTFFLRTNAQAPFGMGAAGAKS